METGSGSHRHWIIPNSRKRRTTLVSQSWQTRIQSASACTSPLICAPSQLRHSGLLVRIRKSPLPNLPIRSYQIRSLARLPPLRYQLTCASGRPLQLCQHLVHRRTRPLRSPPTYGKDQLLQQQHHHPRLSPPLRRLPLCLKPSQS